MSNVPSKTVRDLLGKMKPQFQMALPKHISADRFIRVALTCINRTPKLAECTPESLLEKLMDLAQLGLVADSVSGQAYILPFEDTRNKRVVAQLIVGYQGLIELAYRHPKVAAIRWSNVHEKDHFEWAEGIAPKLVHVPSNEEDRGKLRYTYAIAQLEGGAMTWVVLTRSEVMALKARSRSAKSAYSPWTTDEPAMWSKSAVRQLAKRLPKSNELAEALSKDDDEAIDVDATTVIAESKLLDAATTEKADLKPKDEPEKVPIKKAETNEELIV